MNMDPPREVFPVEAQELQVKDHPKLILHLQPVLMELIKAQEH